MTKAAKEESPAAGHAMRCLWLNSQLQQLDVVFYVFATSTQSFRFSLAGLYKLHSPGISTAADEVTRDGIKSRIKRAGGRHRTLEFSAATKLYAETLRPVTMPFLRYMKPALKKR